jgi:hypothetical protein
VLDSVCVYIQLEVERYFVSFGCKRNFVWFKIAYQLLDGGRIFVCVYACDVSSEAEAARNLGCDPFDTCPSGNVAYGR